MCDKKTVNCRAYMAYMAARTPEVIEMSTTTSWGYDDWEIYHNG